MWILDGSTSDSGGFGNTIIKSNIQKIMRDGEFSVKQHEYIYPIVQSTGSKNFHLPLELNSKGPW